MGIVSFLRGLSEGKKVLLLSFAVGITAGFAAVLLLTLIELVREGGALISGGAQWGNFVLPGVGMLLSLLIVKFIVKDNISHGVTRALVAVSKNDSHIKAHNTWSSILTSSLTIGLGGSVGAEAPIVYTGAAIGSNFGKAFDLSYKNITVLLGCGAAGAVAGIFKAPMAGVLFALEILLFNVSLSSLMPLLVSTLSATVVACLLRGTEPMFACELTQFSMGNIPFYILLGIISGFGSIYFIRTTLWLEDRFSHIRSSYFKWASCAVLLGVLILIFPVLYGEGYDSIRTLLGGGMIDEGILPFSLKGATVPLIILAIFLIKVFAMAATNAGGGVGGTFGPTLFEGALMGFLVARIINLCGASVPEQNFVLVGMAALMAGVMQAPMTAIFLIAEISGGYQLMLPLILTATVSFGVTRLFEQYSIYTKRIAQSGELLTHDNDQAVLTLLKTENFVRDKYPRLDPRMKLGDAIDLISQTTAQVYPVVDKDGRLQGIIDMDDFRHILFKQDLRKTTSVHNYMVQPPAFVQIDERMESVMKKFESTQAWRLPVIDSDRKYYGFISKSRLLTAYREELKAITSQD